MKPAYLIAALIFFAGMTLFTFIRKGTTSAAPMLTPDEVLAQIETGQSVILLDVRTSDEFSGGHIPNSKWIPLNQMEKRLGELPKDSSIVIICRSGVRSEDAARIMRRGGYENMKIMAGGLMGWRGKLTREP